MHQTSRVVRVFLSSTFRDFSEERDLLVRKVFPELRRRCRERQVELVDVDLRWGITEEEAQQGKVLPICLAEIDRSRPYFMGFIGERYGWVPERDQYELPLLLEQSWLEAYRGDKSVTELEMLYGVLNNPAMQNRALFYFRDPAYSIAKGGAYITEGSREKGKLEALKSRIRQSGFPVVETFKSPEELADRVKADLWKLIDDAFPENQVPDPLTRERIRHETFIGSRLGLYIGGQDYFAAIDSAVKRNPVGQVLVTGDSGGGKSALLSNWASRFSRHHPNSILLVHCLAAGADAAHPLHIVVRILREISRLIGTELTLEGDPRKAFHILPEWLAKAGAFAREKSGVFILVLDGLDKLSPSQDIAWLPATFPDGTGVVASCLPGSVRDALQNRMQWDILHVSPLQPEHCARFIEAHLGKYRKFLPSKVTNCILAHPLSGNPLFLRTLLEELRVFGVHEELSSRVSHYLRSTTISDLFERVLERVEMDTTHDSVRAVLEVLWAARESFAEDELLRVSELPPAVWAAIHSALDESLIDSGGRLSFSHDYLREAVQDRYLPTDADRRRIREDLALFCVQSMQEERGNLSHYVRRHAVQHFLQTEAWDHAVSALSDLNFIGARAGAQELPEMLMDYSNAADLLPDGETERVHKAAFQAELDRYARNMETYAAAWSRIRDGSREEAPKLLRPLEQVRMWTSEEIAAERKRISETPNRLDIVKAFRVFIANHTAPLQTWASLEGFVAQLAASNASGGPVHAAGKRTLERLQCIKLNKQFMPDEIYNPLPACRAVLEGHSNLVESVVLSANSRRVVSGSWDNTVRVWDVESGQCLKVLKGHTFRVSSVVLSADDRRVISVSDDKTLRVWDLESGQCLKVLQTRTNLGKSVVISADGRRLISVARVVPSSAAARDNTLQVWDVDSGECLKVLDGHTKQVGPVVLSKDGRRVISGSRDNTIRVWDLESGECLKVLQGHTSWVSSVVLSANGSRLISGSADNTLRVWDLESAECLEVLQGHTDWVSSAVLSADGRYTVSGSGDSTLRVWNIESGECLKVLHGHTNWVSSVMLSANGRHVISGSADNTLRVWDLESAECLKVLHGHTDWVCSAVLSPDGRCVVSGSGDNTLRVWNIESGECLKALQGHTQSVGPILLSADGRLAISLSKRPPSSWLAPEASGDDTLRVWDLESGKCLKVLHGHTRRVISAVINTDGRRVVSGSDDSTLRVWDVVSSECLKVLEGHTAGVNSVALSLDGRRVISGSNDKTLRVWNIESGHCLKVLEGHTDGVNSVALSADGRRVISGSYDGTLRVWDLEKGECLKVLQGHTNWVISAVISTDGRRVVSGSDDSTLRVWDVVSGECLKVLEGHTDGVNSVALSLDGRRVISGSNDKTLRVWNIESGHCFKVLEGHTDANSVALSPDGSRVISGSYDGTLRVWDLESGECLAVFFLRGLTSISISWSNCMLIAGLSDGTVRRFHFENLSLGPFITPAQREICSPGVPAGSSGAAPPLLPKTHLNP
jgi:WD40 repeat protein